MCFKVENNQENREKLFDMMQDFHEEGELNKEEVMEEMRNDTKIFLHYLTENSMPQEWGIFDDEDYLSNEEISELEDPPDLLY